MFIYLFYLSTCFGLGLLCAHHLEKQLYLCNTWYLSLCMDEWYTRHSSIQSDKYQSPIDTVVSPDDGHLVAQNMRGGGE